MNVNKMAAQDAAKWAAAEMFFGEGAGTRRKLLQAEIATKVERISGYHEAFEAALAKQDMAKHAVNAYKERKRLDRSKAFKRNARGVLTGNRRSLTTGVGILVGAWVIAQQTGLDEPIKAEVKKQYRKTRDWVKRQDAKRKLKKQFNVKMNEDGTYRFKA